MSEQPVAPQPAPAHVAQPQDHQATHFTYTTPQGVTVTLPRFKKALTFGRMRKMRHLSEQEMTFQIMEETCTEETLAALDELDTEESEAFMRAWHADSGINLGESAAS